MIQFEVGKTYETIHIDTSIIICARSKHFVTFKVIRPGAPDRTLRKKISVCLLTNKESWEYIRTNGLCHVWCNAQDLADSQPEASQHEKPQTCSNPDTTNITHADDNSRNTQTVQEDTQNAQTETVKFVVGKTYANDSPMGGYPNSYTITGKSENFVYFVTYFLHRPGRKKLRIGTDRNGIPCEYFDDKIKGSPIPAQMVFATALDLDVKENKIEDTKPAYLTHNNPGFTVVPSEHIQRPEYTVYPDTITDECTYTVIPACDIPAHNPAAAVVPYADARNIRNFFHILAIYIRMWLAINIHKRDIAIPMPGVFPPDVIAKSTTAKKRPALIPQKQERKEAWQSHSSGFISGDCTMNCVRKKYTGGKHNERGKTGKTKD